VSVGVFYRHNEVELAVKLKSQFQDMWWLRDRWSNTRITFSSPELASLRDVLNRLDLPASSVEAGDHSERLSSGYH